MKRGPLLLAGLLLLAVISAGAAWLARRRATPPPTPARGGVLLLYTGERLGELEPCGCARPQTGGVEQLAGLLARPVLRPGRRVLLDAGNLVAHGGRQQELKYAATIAAMNELGYAAAALGPRDLQLGLPFLVGAARQARFPLLAANLTDEQGRRPFAGLAVLPLPEPAGARLLVVGLLPVAPLPGGPRIEPPADALRRELSAVPGGVQPADRLVLLGVFSAADARELASAAGRPALAIHGRGELPPADAPVELPGGGTALGIGGKGRMLGAYELSGPAAGRLALHRVLDPGPAPAIKQILVRYQRALGAEDILGQLPRRAAAGKLVGSGACRSCHQAAHDVWGASRHARALVTLERSGHDRDPECVACHVTGLDRRDGFTSRAETPDLARVGCESCHGPGGRHAAAPAADNIERGSPQTCRGCHAAEHDPHFDYAGRWKRIAH